MEEINYPKEDSKIISSLIARALDRSWEGKEIQAQGFSVNGGGCSANVTLECIHLNYPFVSIQLRRSISFPISAELYRYLPIDVHVIIQSSRSVQPSFHSLSLSGREWSVQEPLKKLQLAAFESWNNKLLIGSHCVESDCANGSA